ncbi:MAG: hypothetical protein ACRDPA_26205, partial [Solirubrobacteraceae bacterium]
MPESEGRREGIHARHFLGDFTRIPVHALDSPADEREANSVADRVLASPPGPEGTRWRRSVGRPATGGPAPRDVSDAASGQGRPLEPAVRESME